VLGIQPVHAGYQSWLVQPHPGDLAWTEGQAPTPHGTIAVHWSHDAATDAFTMRVQAPSGTSGTIAVPTFGRTVDIDVNGHKVWRHSGSIAGAAGVRSASQDGDYIDLKVGAGTYDVATKPTPGG
jgi:alpha-L-rhamnosidase